MTFIDEFLEIIDEFYGIIDSDNFDAKIIVLYDRINKLITQHNYTYEEFISELKKWISNREANTDIEKLVKVIVTMH